MLLCFHSIATVKMQTSRLVVLLFLTICWVPVSVATANCTASLPSTIAEVHDALQQLGYQNAAGVLRSDHLPDGNSGSTKDRCVTTVSAVQAERILVGLSIDH